MSSRKLALEEGTELERGAFEADDLACTAVKIFPTSYSRPRVKGSLEAQIKQVDIFKLFYVHFY
jgi:hypothetical protein